MGKRQCQINEFETVFHQYKDMVFRTAYLVMGDANEAEDILQEVFIRVHKYWGDYDSQKGAMSTWLRRITVNQCISSRRRKHHPSVSLDKVVEQGLDPPDVINESPEEQLMRNERSEMVWHAMDALDNNHRAVVVLRYFDDLSYEEIAKILDIPLGTVKSRLNTAVRSLRMELTAGGVA